MRINHKCESSNLIEILFQRKSSIPCVQPWFFFGHIFSSDIIRPLWSNLNKWKIKISNSMRNDSFSIKVITYMVIVTHCTFLFEICVLKVAKYKIFVFIFGSFATWSRRHKYLCLLNYFLSFSLSNFNSNLGKSWNFFPL